MNKILLFVCALLAVVTLVSCGENVSEETYFSSNDTSFTQALDLAEEKAELTEMNKNLSFADNLMKMTEGDGNRMISPYSAKMCLALLANGANGETKEQILGAIGISDIDEYNAAVKELLENMIFCKDGTLVYFTLSFGKNAA